MADDMKSSIATLVKRSTEDNATFIVHLLNVMMYDCHSGQRVVPSLKNKQEAEDMLLTLIENLQAPEREIKPKAGDFLLSGMVKDLFDQLSGHTPRASFLYACSVLREYVQDTAGNFDLGTLGRLVLLYEACFPAQFDLNC